MPVVLITPIRWSRSPIQSFFLFLLFVAGVLILTGISQSAIVTRVGPPWSHFWAGALILGAGISLTGAYWKNQITGMLIERSGIFLLGLASFYWFVAVLWFTKFDGVITEIGGLLFSVICYLQVKYINKHINLILDAIDKGGRVRE